MAPPRNGNGKMFVDKQNEYLQRKKEDKKNRVKYLKRKVKLGTATKKDREELRVLQEKK